MCKYIAHSKGFLHSPVFLPCWVTCVTCPSLFSPATSFLSCHGLYASFPTLSSYVCSFAPLVSLRGQVVPLVSLCWGSRHSFLLCRSPQLVSSLLVPSVLQHGEDLLSSQILTCLIPSSSFPLILFYHGDKSEALQRVSVMIPRWETGKGKEILSLMVLSFFLIWRQLLRH